MLIPVLLGVSVLVFLILQLSPGNPAEVIAGSDAPPETIEAIERQLGLDRPLHVQFSKFLINAVQGDLGVSIRARVPVTSEVARTFPVTVQLTVVGVFFSSAVAIPLGVISAVRRDSLLDNFTMFLAFLGISMPVFAVGIFLMWWFSYKLGWFPISGFAPLTTYEGWRRIVLPAITVSAASIATIARLTRSSMLEVLGFDYIRTARAKGWPSATSSINMRSRTRSFRS